MAKKESGKSSLPSASRDHDAAFHDSRGNSTHRQSPLCGSATAGTVHSAPLASQTLAANSTASPALRTSTRTWRNGRSMGFLRNRSLNGTPFEANRHASAGGDPTAVSSLTANSRFSRSWSRDVSHSPMPAPSNRTSVSSARAARAPTTTITKARACFVFMPAL